MPDSLGQPRIIYIHGFNSSPDSEKAQEFLQYSQIHHQDIEVLIPVLPFDPREAIALLEAELLKSNQCYLVGSSLGGYYSSYLAEKHSLKAALINPAVSPAKNLSDDFLGLHTNHYSGETYELTMNHVNYLSTLDTDVIQCPERFLVLVQTGDEVLDYRHALERYKGSAKIVQAGGDHRFTNLDSVLPDIFQFSGLIH